MNNKITKLISVLAAMFLLFSALSLGVSADQSTDITADVKHPYTMTILPHPHGELIYVAPEPLYKDDTISFTAVPDTGYALKSLGWYTNDSASVTDITESKLITMPAADITVMAEFAMLCNVTFHMQGHGTQVQSYTGVTAGSRIDAPVSPTASGYAFGGWYREQDCTNAWNFGSDVVTDHTTLYAKWIGNDTPRAVIDGSVTEEGNVAVPDAKVELLTGTVRVAATKTDENGRYSFGTVEHGIYNIVITDESGKIKTELLTVDKTGELIWDIELPRKAVNSVVEFSGSEIPGTRSDISKTVVGGLDVIAEKQNPGDGGKITIGLTVEPKPYTGTDEQKSIRNTVGNGKNIEFLDMDLWKQVNNGDHDTINDANDTLLTIVIPFDFTKADVPGIMILRSRGEETTKLTAEPNEYGESFAVDADAGIITLYAKKFSGYAIAYDTLHEHEWESDFTVDREPTCTQDGSKSIHCAHCSAVKDSTVIPRSEHQWGNETVAKEATKTEDGEKICTCEKCGEVRHTVIPKIGSGHNSIVHWVMIALLVLFLILFSVFTLLKKKLFAYITCGACGAAAIVLLFFGGCTVCTLLTVVNLVVIAAGALYTLLRKNVSRQ